MSKPEEKKGPKKESTPGGTAGICLVGGCKTSPKRFEFCPEHFEQFKFGLIKKDGKPVSDWEKKFEHYEAYKKKQSARKVA